MIQEIKLGKFKISEKGPAFIIAEGGSNFRISDDMDKNFMHALKLIDIAANAKANAIKFQIYRASKLYAKDAGYADYLGKKKSIYNIIEGMEMPYEWLPKLQKYSQNKGIIFFACPFDERSAEELNKIKIPFYKIASYSITNFPLLKKIAQYGKPIIMSTGASDIHEIEEAKNYLAKHGNNQVIILQCTAKYPAPLESINLRALTTLRNRLKCFVGLSDHSREPYIAPVGAVALGAKVIEKHFTTDNSLPGPDHRFAILENELEVLVDNIRKLEKALGDEKKTIQESEIELYKFARHFIFSIKTINRGEKFTKHNILPLRPGKREHGLEPKYFDKIIGKKAMKNIKEQTPITPELIEGFDKK